MTHRIEFLPEAAEDLRDLDGSERKIVVKGLRKLETEPEKRGLPLGSRQKTGDLTTFRKLVVGDKQYRIVYRVEPSKVVVIWVVAARTDDKCYDLAVARLQIHPDRALANELAGMLKEAWQK
ncbi:MULTISPECIES: type II toxin-antitoxin system RelE/ParE family toxin [Rhodococcus]|uniref:type II toxin-antitoxin system RelE family toxin n=1 Tax=Rhodococcus TaxID=1827 RepID=UPI001C57B124|nr:type II toxin-antitoxin system mRNA interferase toxin, RelE/StbE family [Rhodococcus sp. LW-XY12]QXU56632.1 type II toxin-antitoxin system mRNA interferase toxin, RelE/StbE family [Rhodococcus sp. LW-XY12]